MAKITITIEDLPNGNVKVVCDPSFETIMMMNESGHQLTAGHGYAFCALNAIKKESKNKGPTRILVPRVGR